MNPMRERAAPGSHQQKHVDGPPRLNSSRCGNYHTVANGLNQPPSGASASQNDKPAGEKMTKSTALVAATEQNAVAGYFSNQQVEILKNSICKGASNEEFEIFLMACKKTQLDPFMRQIYAVKRWDNRLKRETMTIQTGIDGYRLIAERTERYAPGPKPTFEYDPQGQLISATAYVKKLTKDGTWHVVEAEAFFDEYCQTTKDKNTGEIKATGMWGNMQRNQLAKCAESLALRKAFPAEMSGVYTKEEMKQAEYQDVTPKISLEQAAELDMILSECDEKYRNWVYEYMKKQYQTNNLSELPADLFDRMKSAAVKNMEQNHAKQMAENQPQLVAAEVQ